MLYRTQKLRCFFRWVHTETAKSEYWPLHVCQYTRLSVLLSVRLFTWIMLTRTGQECVKVDSGNLSALPSAVKMGHKYLSLCDMTYMYLQLLRLLMLTRLTLLPLFLWLPLLRWILSH